MQRKETIKMHMEHQSKCMCFDCGTTYDKRNNIRLHVSNGNCCTIPKKKCKRLCDLVKDNDVVNYKPRIKCKKLKERIANIKSRLLIENDCVKKEETSNDDSSSLDHEEEMMNEENQVDDDDVHTVPNDHRHLRERKRKDRH